MDGHDSQNDFSHSDLVRSNEDEVQVVGETSGTSWYYAVLLTVNAGLGASLLAFPQAYDLAGGIPMSLTFLVLIALTSIGSLIILAYCADINTSGSYQETVEACCGVRWNMVCSLVIAAYSFGCCVTYLIIIGDLWDKVFDFAISNPMIRNAWYLDRRFVISTTSLAIILPMCFLKRIDFLRFAR
ncbi:putative amino acid transporter ixodes scapularis amino acid transporter [Fasciolopsis buskii]|uniref:Putative amino acid transporter ixodes scapularis amino acid transporter n=1 Tax=Fasciolopsis buskii TaxID=27845 RepID=A0A8E0VCK8_9TREM|nr:putative amino acid transporter ixodes scapularis amino acid transporter [Fasciolopsis buski]